MAGQDKIHVEKEINLFEKRFIGFKWAVDPQGLTILASPIVPYGGELLEESERDRFLQSTTLDFILANQNTGIGQSYLASQCVRQHPSCGIQIPGYPGEWLVYTGSNEETQNKKQGAKGQDTPLVLLYGGGKNIRIDDGQTILRLCFHKSNTMYEDDILKDNFWECKSEAKNECVWCGKSSKLGFHDHSSEVIKARKIIGLHLKT